MSINLFPHLSSSYSMFRYFKGFSETLEQRHQARVSPVFNGKRLYSLKEKYIQYPRDAARIKTGYTIILSETFSFLTLFLKKDTACIICHDLLTLRVPRLSLTHKLWFRYLLRSMMRARLIICISEATRADLLLFAPHIQPAKVKVVHNGIENFWHTDVLDASLAENLPGDYFLMVGTDAWNKNLPAVIQAMHQLKEEAWLVKVGAISQSNWELIEKAGVGHYIKHFPEVTDLQLKGLYRKARALLMPSLYEGFGWPALEAMASGCPVLASLQTGLAEVCGDAACYVDPRDVDSVIKGMRKLSDGHYRADLSSKGRAQSEKFSWRKNVDDILSALDREAFQ